LASTAGWPFWAGNTITLNIPVILFFD